jgi:HK97 family phage portal protein
MEPAGAQIDLKPGQAYASYPLPYEIQTPQYTYPNALTMTRSGYKTSEFAYSIIMKRARAKSSAPLWVWDNSGEHPEEMPDHDMTMFLKRVNQYIGQRMFWQITQIFRDIAGFAAWEIESDRGGTPLRLWPMLPHWCSFLRGAPFNDDGTANPYSRIRAIRYQPYGLAPMDIPMDRVIFMSNGESYDPEYNSVRFYSPLMHAFPIVEVDSGMTLFLNDFVKHGAKFSGLISVAQTITDTTAKDIQRRFSEYHGGAENWSQPLVLGNGSDYKTMQMNFRDMAFAELDARNETRICNAFDMDPIVANARAGLDVSSYNNKTEADKNWMHTWLVPAWEEDAESLTEQLLPRFESNPDNFYCAFQTKDVWGLNEDRDSLSKRTVEEAKAGIIDRDEAREALNLDPIDVDEQGNPITDESGEPVHTWLNVTIRESASTTGAAELTQGEGDAPMGQEAKPAQKPTEEQVAAADAEEKDFRKFARKRTKEGKADIIKDFEFKFVSPGRQAELLAEFGIIVAVAEKNTEGEALMIYQELKRLADAFKNAPSGPTVVRLETAEDRDTIRNEIRSSIRGIPAPVVNVQPQKVDVNIDMTPLAGAFDRMAEVIKAKDTINNIEVKIPTPTKRKAKVTFNSDGKPVAIEDV